MERLGRNFGHLANLLTRRSARSHHKNFLALRLARADVRSFHRDRRRSDVLSSCARFIDAAHRPLVDAAQGQGERGGLVRSVKKETRCPVTQSVRENLSVGRAR
jgi:hypothetical protein